MCRKAFFKHALGKILEDLGYGLEMPGQKQVDSMAQSMKRQVGSRNGFRQGENRARRKKEELSIWEGAPGPKEAREVLRKPLKEEVRQAKEFI